MAKNSRYFFHIFYLITVLIVLLVSIVKNSNNLALPSVLWCRTDVFGEHWERHMSTSELHLADVRVNQELYW